MGSSADIFVDLPNEFVYTDPDAEELCQIQSYIQWRCVDKDGGIETVSNVSIENTSAPCTEFSSNTDLPAPDF